MAMILNLFRIYLNPIIVFMWRCFRRSLEKQAELRNQQEMEKCVFNGIKPGSESDICEINRSQLGHFYAWRLPGYQAFC